jgi:hypothetical protein
MRYYSMRPLHEHQNIALLKERYRNADTVVACIMGYCAVEVIAVL